jgi:hypothetical protein
MGEQNGMVLSLLKWILKNIETAASQDKMFAHRLGKPRRRGWGKGWFGYILLLT